MRILITGASGQLGGYLLRELQEGKQTVVAWSGARLGSLFGVPWQPVNLTDKDTVAVAFRAARPEVVLHAAALSNMGRCYQQPQVAHTVNVDGTALLAELTETARARLILVSTDLVFNGSRGHYREEDAPAPQSVYGRTKAAAEAAILARPRGLVTRVSLLFGPTLVGRSAFFDQQVAALRQGRPCALFTDEWRTPMSLPAAAAALISLARSDFTGILHVGGPERLSRLEMGQQLARILGADPSNLVAATRAQAPGAEPRPCDTSLDSSRWRALFPHLPWPTWSEALKGMALA